MSADRIALVGLGGMGSGIAHALLEAGFSLIVFNRTREKAVPLVEAGAELASSVPTAVESVDTVLVSLSDESAVTSVVLEEMLPVLRRGTSVIDTSTVSPPFARHCARELAAVGVRRVEACVVGNPPMARSGQLRVFTSGERADVDRNRAVLTAMSQEMVHLGAAGTASALKLSLNLLLGVQTAGLADAVALAEAEGIEREVLLDAVDNSGWRSPVLSFRSRFMRSRSYTPAGFRAALMHKDVELARTRAAEHGVELPVAAAVAERFGAALDHGYRDEDAAVVAEITTVPEEG